MFTFVFDARHSPPGVYGNDNGKIDFMSCSKAYYLRKSGDYDRKGFGFGYLPASVNGLTVRQGFRLKRPWEKFTIEVRYGLPQRGEADRLPVDAHDGYAIVEYHILHVPRYIFAVIDPDNPDRSGDIFFSPHFRQRAIRDRDVFAVEADTSTVYLSGALKTALERERLSGIGFGSPGVS
jgi:hypothetical protein